VTTPRRTALAALLLLFALAAQLALSTARQSQSWDEGDHIYAGYRSLTEGDFGLNPEHPPLVKLLAAAPLTFMRLTVPPLEGRDFKREAFLGGRAFVFGNDAEAVLAWARVGPALLTLALAALTFLAAREMFGGAAALLALALLAFDPNLIAHGAYVTTDVALCLFSLAAAYTFYRYVKAPSAARLALVGLATGLAMASKHAGALVPIILVLLAAVEVALPGGEGAPSRGRRALRLVGALAVVGVMALAIVWAFYGFRFASRPDGLALNPPFAQVMAGLPKPHQGRLLSALAHWRVFPESYLYGMADVLVMEDFYHSYALGRVYLHGVWFYFPLAYAVKSTLAFVLLPLVVAATAAARWLRGRRELLFMAVPPAVHFLVGATSRLNIGVRHILPVYAFVAILGGAALAVLLRRHRRWALAAGALVALHVVSSLRTFPAYIAYSNELAGGPAQTHRWLSDSNADWAQQLKSVKRYLDARGVRECWFAYFAEGTVDMAHYGIPCRPLPTIDGFWLNEVGQVPAEVDGPVLISAGALSGFEYGPPPLQPYASFKDVRPTALIDGGVFVFDGRFRMDAASAMGLAEKARLDLAAGRVAEAERDARQAVALAPQSVPANAALGDALVEAGRAAEARPFYEAALHAARTIAPEFQAGWVGGLEKKILSLPPVDPPRPRSSSG
jgi:4-amino-4-deoxy-L-arabinose transferase-like glycosyltransferase